LFLGLHFLPLPKRKNVSIKKVNAASNQDTLLSIREKLSLYILSLFEKQTFQAIPEQIDEYDLAEQLTAKQPIPFVGTSSQ
jgi:hypothetical protein